MMNGFIARVYGFLVGFMSFAVFGGAIYLVLNGTINTSNFGIGGGLFTALALFVYIVVIGTLSVLIHTRELAEQQLETLKQIQYQLRQLNFTSGDGQDSVEYSGPPFLIK